METRKKPRDKLIITIVCCFYLLVLIAIIKSLIKGYLDVVVIAMILIVLIMVPFITDHYIRLKGIVVTRKLKLIYLFFIFITIFLGDMGKFYERFVWWDDMLHFTSGIVIVIFGEDFIHVVNVKEKATLITSSFFIAFFCFNLAVTLGCFWEIAEFFADHVLGTKGSQTDLFETMLDIIMNTAGALVAAAVLYFFRRKRIYRLQGSSGH